MKAYTYGMELNGNTMTFIVGNGATWSSGTTETGFTSGNWQHIVGTYDGTSLRLYRNGVQVGNAVASTLTNSNQVLRAGSLDGASEFFDGQLDEVRIYNRTLDAGEINSLFSYSGVVDSFNYHPADVNPQNKFISAIEASAYINAYFAGGNSLIESLYALTLAQSGGSYTNLSSSGCSVTPWLCWSVN